MCVCVCVCVKIAVSGSVCVCLDCLLSCQRERLSFYPLSLCVCVCVCVCFNRDRESYLTIASVNFSLNGVEVKCEASNTVEDTPASGEASLSLKVFGKPPNPPHLFTSSPENDISLLSLCVCVCVCE